MPSSRKSGISIAVPNKGRLSEAAADLLRRAGLELDAAAPSSRQLLADTWGGRVRVLFVRAQDIPELVEEGLADLGITGLDLILETAKKVQRVMDLGFGRCRLVAAIPEKRGIRRPEDLPKRLTVATAFPNLTRRFFQGLGKQVRIVPVSGATEVMPHIGVADVITDLTQTGSTLAMNDLVEIAALQDSSAQLIAHPASWNAPRKRRLMEEVQFALASVVHAGGKRYLMADVPRKALSRVQAALPGIAGPTVMDIYGRQEWKAVHVVVDEAEVYQAMRRLKRLGAAGILVVPVDRMVR